MHPDGPTPLEMLEEDLYLVSGLGIMLLPLFPLTVPAVVLLGLVVVPLAVVGLLAVLIGTILASPYLVVRSLRQQAIEADRA
jgi:hypothetical protein